MSCVICRVVRVAALLQACLARTCFRAPASVDGWYGISWREYPFVGVGSYFDSISFTAMTCTMGVYVNWIEYPNSGWDSPKDEHGASPRCSGQVPPNQYSNITCGKTGLHYTVHPAVWGECSRAEICDVQGVSHLKLIIGTQVDYVWSAGEWGSCSETCGPGTKTRSVSCSPDPGYCNQNDKPSMTDDCNLASCQWDIQSWGACSHLCGGGERNRVVTCPRDDSYCTETKPATTEACNEQNCSTTTEAFAGEADDPSSVPDDLVVPLLTPFGSGIFGIFLGACAAYFCCRKKDGPKPNRTWLYDDHIPNERFPYGSGSKVAMFSARFDGGETERKFRDVHRILQQYEYDVLMVSSDHGDDSGVLTRSYLHRLKQEDGVMLAVCTPHYGEVTASKFSSNFELGYAMDNCIKVLPLQTHDQFPPRPPAGPEHAFDKDRIAQGYISAVFMASVARLDCLDCRSISDEEIALHIAKCLHEPGASEVDGFLTLRFNGMCSSPQPQLPAGLGQICNV